jgi:4-amino-4-deoxy-L-arabinose transferase-like glycosyltransferase
MRIRKLNRMSTQLKLNQSISSCGPQSVGFLGKRLWRSPAACILLPLMIISLGIFLRCFCLSADPPLDLSWSQDINTDPDQYTSFARSKALWGSWDLFGHNLVLCLNSALTLFSFLFFKLLGVGRWQANFVAASLSSATLLFFYLAIRKGKDQKTALLATFFLSVNYILVMYSRSTFAEVQVVFFLVLGIYLLILGWKRSWLLIFSGACFASAVFFGKVLAVFMLPVCLGVVVIGALDQFSSDHRKIKFSPLLFFAAGFLAVVLPWFFMIYSPSAASISGFVSGVSVEMYGSPRAFGSIFDFVQSVFSFGEVTRVFSGGEYSMGTDLFFRMPFLFILSCVFLLTFLFKMFKAKGTFDNLKSCSKLEFFFGLWLVVGVLALMIWNYRPLRYQILLIPPMCALAAFCLSDFLNRSRAEGKTKTSVFFWIFSVPLASLLIFHTISFFLKTVPNLANFDSIIIIWLSSIPLAPFLVFYTVALLFLLKIFPSVPSLNLVLLISFFLSVPLTYVLHQVKNRETSSARQSYRIVTVAVVVFLVALVNGGQFWGFARNLQYSFIHSSQDLGRILSPEAVISGPYSPTLALENKLRLLIHMFLPGFEDPDFFLKHPVTHLALEAERGQRKRAFMEYPEVMKNARVVTTYYLRNFPVQILRVAESSGNPETGNYRLSDFEKAKLLKEAGQIDSAVVVLNQFVSEHPENLSGYVTLAQIYHDKRDLGRAASFLRKASGFDPTNSLLHRFLGDVYLNLYNQTKDDTYKSLVIEEWQRALRLFPQNTELGARLEKIRGD